MSDWSGLPEALQTALDNIALHGDEEKTAELGKFTAEAYVDSIDQIRPAALALYDYWMDNPKEAPVKQPIVNAQKVGRNDPCPCGSGKKYKQCCLAK
ncbi:Predicted metal-binding protein related to the C-terminal domain of SecA [Kluyvera cryocrescens]|nr:Predicted metal-binding protein related to the C-terminal domain of SecA [Kluyvera cryocrescens]